MNPLSWSLDVWFVVLQSLSALILGVTIAVGFFANKRLTEKVALIDKARVDAESQLLELRLRTWPRTFDHNRFLEALKGKPKGKVEILYQPEIREAFNFAGYIRRWLGAGDNGDGAGWDVSEPRAIPAEGGILGLPKDEPRDMRYGAWTGFAVWSNKLPKPGENESALGALLEAFRLSSGEFGFGYVISEIPNLPDDSFVIVVGQKP